jgi:hypothetical protein
VALSATNSFYEGIQRQHFKKLENSDGFLETAGDHHGPEDHRLRAGSLRGKKRGTC